ncbi:hypothetical protein HC251_17600 [Iamia sp. SCSIO 61187]|uniref:hypothetical protein n=1 Tax=Iamia sp. SCSIO 61187 TaxID=2722752 RepID=UPI001C628114|nr:hypothetical protein [Iamia sp. SCSIO 61187]QYG94073.1 hypothetical protein HC251_17600 [Iamia sp. SCSIO 61187]
MTRRWTAALCVVLTVSALLGTGTGPSAAAAEPEACAASDAAAFVCRAHASFARRPATTAEVDTWAPQLPARRTSFVAGLARGVESRDATVLAYYERFGGFTPTAGDLAYWREQILLVNGLRRLEAALLANSPTTDAELVDAAYALLLGRTPSDPDRRYWTTRISQSTRNRVVAQIGGSIEGRRVRVRWAYHNEILVTVDVASRDYWAERLRTGTSYLDLRIALHASPDGYRASGAACASPVPQVGPACP